MKIHPLVVYRFLSLDKWLELCIYNIEIRMVHMPSGSMWNVQEWDIWWGNQTLSEIMLGRSWVFYCFDFQVPHLSKWFRCNLQFFWKKMEAFEILHSVSYRTPKLSLSFLAYSAASKGTKHIYMQKITSTYLAFSSELHARLCNFWMNREQVLTGQT